MTDNDVQLSDAERSVKLAGVEVIGVSATHPREHDYGASTVRFTLNGKGVAWDELNALSEWYHDGTVLTLTVGTGPDVKPCSLRECALDPSTQQFYVQVYTPFPFQHLRDWFDGR